MQKKTSIFFITALIFLFPISYFAFGQYINFDTLSAILFVLIIAFLIAKYHKNLEFQPFLKIGSIPLIYAVLWKTKFGLKFMEKVSTKFREFVKLVGYCFVGFGFFGLLYVSISILFLLWSLFVTPRQASEGVSLVLPLTNIPGAGYLSFWHFLITLFITVLIHEFSHGIMARAHNVPIKSSGLGALSLIVPLFPLAFVEPDEKKLLKEKDIVQYSIFAAGPLVNIILALILLIAMPYVGYNVTQNSVSLAPFEDKITEPLGISFAALQPDYPANKSGLMPGVIINKVNDMQINDSDQFLQYIVNTKPDQQIVLSSKNESFTLTLAKNPDNKTTWGYLGVLGIVNEREVKPAYSGIKDIFYWLKGLFKWIFFINLAIGLMNLLPLMITDGGRMLKVAFEKIFGDEKKAARAWVIVGGIFLFTILFALILRYFFYPFINAIGLG
jgi:membrane-associated protease RseP (regulator of RpoE activity)